MVFVNGIRGRAFLHLETIAKILTGYCIYDTGLSCISFSEKTDMYPLGSGRLIHSHTDITPYKNTDCAYKSDFLCI